MDQSDCELYYRRRSDELNEWMHRELQTANVRNELFMDVLRVKLERRMNRSGGESRSLAIAVAEARKELGINMKHGREVLDRASRQIGPFVDSLRLGEGDENVILAELAAEQSRLDEMVRMRRERLHSIFDSVQSILIQLDHERSMIERVNTNAVVSIPSAESVDRVRTIVDG